VLEVLEAFPKGHGNLLKEVAHKVHVAVAINATSSEDETSMAREELLVVIYLFAVCHYFSFLTNNSCKKG
jgi:hypothetical protein